ncbi:MFS transporter [Ammoniphilus sp. YIM 78166]|uniref:MFS transporter n=1 Tax=Ammoniphilus sp. YIM 78166 TaxID=1644106 RepID=UPI00106F4185|nr:MFS transporter [Ammoniphilus sp. YIM 78166]
MKKQIYVVLFMNTVFSSVVSFSNIFINIFLWNQGKSLRTIGIYNLTVFTFLFIGYLFGSYVMKWTNSRMALFLSALVLATVFVFLLLQQENIVQYVVPLGALYGLATGMYFSGFNLFSVLLTNAENRQFFVGMEQLTERLSALVTPILFSYLIMWFSYTDTFRMILVLLVIQTLVSLFTPLYHSDFRLRSFNYRETWRQYKLILISILAFGFLQSVIQLAGSVLLFSFIQQETVIGWLNTLFALVGIMTVIFLSRTFPVKRKLRIAYIGAITTTLTVPLLLIEDKWFLIVFNLLVSIALPLLWVPVSVTHFGKIKQIACQSDVVCEPSSTIHYLMIREGMLSIGRASFYLLLILGFDFKHGLHLIPIILVSMMIPVFIFIFNRRMFLEQG